MNTFHVPCLAGDEGPFAVHNACVPFSVAQDEDFGLSHDNLDDTLPTFVLPVSPSLLFCMFVDTPVHIATCDVNNFGEEGFVVVIQCQWKSVKQVCSIVQQSASPL